MRRAVPAFLFCAFMVVACNGTGGGSGVNIKTVGSTKPIAAGDLNKTASLKGTVLAPKGYQAETGTKKFALLDEGSSEGPLAGVEVYLASRSGERYRGPIASTTSISGQFEIKNVPNNLTFLVMTNTLDPELHHAEFCGMARSLADGTTIEISYATTVITKATVNPPSTVTASGQVTVSPPPLTASGQVTVSPPPPITATGNALGNFDPTIYLGAVAAVKSQIDFTQLPNLETPGAVEAILAKVKVGGIPLTTTIATLQGGLFANGVTADAVQNALNNININFAGTGSTTVNGQTTGTGSTQGNGSLDTSQLGAVLGGLLGTPAPTAAPAATATPAPAASASAKP